MSSNPFGEGFETYSIPITVNPRLARFHFRMPYYGGTRLNRTGYLMLGLNTGDKIKYDVFVNAREQTLGVLIHPKGIHSAKVGFEYLRLTAVYYAALSAQSDGFGFSLTIEPSFLTGGEKGFLVSYAAAAIKAEIETPAPVVSQSIEPERAPASDANLPIETPAYREIWNRDRGSFVDDPEHSTGTTMVVLDDMPAELPDGPIVLSSEVHAPDPEVLKTSRKPRKRGTSDIQKDASGIATEIVEAPKELSGRVLQAVNLLRVLDRRFKCGLPALWAVAKAPETKDNMQVIRSEHPELAKVKIGDVTISSQALEIGTLIRAGQPTPEAFMREVAAAL